MHTVEIDETTKRLVSPLTMYTGNIAIVETGNGNFCQYVGHVIMRSFNGLSSLSDPGVTWGEPGINWPDFKVRILPAGTKITITVGE